MPDKPESPTAKVPKAEGLVPVYPKGANTYGMRGSHRERRSRKPQQIAPERPVPSTFPIRAAAFFSAVAGDCGCPRCCDLRNTAQSILSAPDA